MHIYVHEYFKIYSGEKGPVRPKQRQAIRMSLDTALLH